MALDLTVMSKQALAILNAAASFSTTVNDDRYTLLSVQESLLEADAAVCRAKCSVKHPRRAGFLAASSGIAYGGRVPTHIGPIDSIEIDFTGSGDWRPATRSKVWIVRSAKENPDSCFSSTASDLYGIFAFENNADDGTLYYVGPPGSTARAIIATFTKTSSLQADDEDANAVLSGALAQQFSIEGSSESMAAAHGKVFEDYTVMLGREARG